MAIRKINSRAIEDGAVTADDLGSFTSVGIDDNATSTAITIDSSENVLIGKTSTGITSAGTSIRSDGTFELRRDLGVANSSSVGYISRGSTDGNALTFYKDTTSVGTIGSLNSGRDLHVNSTGGILTLTSNFNSTERQVVFGNTYFGPRSTDNNAVDLGRSVSQFKDLYLSGGVFVGGTGSANKLDDYEEGTWTAVDVNDTAYNAYITCTYTKIGRIVYFNFDIASTGSTTGTKLGGLPFTAASSSVSNNWSVYTGYSTSNADICGHINAGTDEVNITVGSTAHTLNGRWIGAGFYYV